MSSLEHGTSTLSPGILLNFFVSWKEEKEEKYLVTNKDRHGKGKLKNVSAKVLPSEHQMMVTVWKNTWNNANPSISENCLLSSDEIIDKIDLCTFSPK